MTNKEFWMAALIAGLGQAALSLPVIAQEKPIEDVKEETEESLEKILFVPHDIDAPKETDAGGVRGLGTAPQLRVIAPERLALSLSPSPTLYWYVSKATQTPVRFTLKLDDPSASAPLLEVNLGAHASPGIYAVPLSRYNIRLKSGQRYIWSITLSSEDGRFGDERTARTKLEHSPSLKLDPFLATSSPFDQTAELASHGYWYDAIDVVSQQIEAGDQTMPWTEIRARLLEQAGLRQVAQFDRRQ